MPHYEQVRHAISARKRHLESIVDGIENRKNGIQDKTTK